MKQLKVTVNGKQYDVVVEEIDGAVAAPAANSNIAAAPAPAAPAAKPASAGGNIKVESPMPGTILAVNVKNNDTVKKGDVLIILEAMKMENEICAPEDGTVVSVNVAKGESVESGALLLSLN